MSKIVRFSRTGGSDVLTLVDESPQQPGPGEVRVAVHATGLNRAEWLFVHGQYLVQPQLPSRLGMEGAGVIEAVGPDVENWQVGDAVCITPHLDAARYGVCGETAVVPQQVLVAKPDYLDFANAAAVWMAYPTAYGGLVCFPPSAKVSRSAVSMWCIIFSTSLSGLPRPKPISSMGCNGGC